MENKEKKEIEIPDSKKMVLETIEQIKHGRLVVYNYEKSECKTHYINKK